MEALNHSQTDDAGSKKSHFDNLSRDDLVKKCKGLLIIAQKAKQSKADIISEHENIKEKCHKMETQKIADKESLRTMQEYIDTLTEQKLSYATELDSLKSQLSKQKALADNMLEELKKIGEENERKQNGLKKDLNDIKNNMETIENENTSLKRQNDRLEKENDSLIKQLDDLEKQIDTLNKLGSEQQQQLLQLENNSNKESNNTTSEQSKEMENKLTSQLESYKIELDTISNEKNILENCCESLKLNLIEKDHLINVAEEKSVKLEVLLKESEEKLIEKEGKLSQYKAECETEKSKKERLNAKLKSYRDKLVKCNSSIAQLKNSKSVLLKTVKDYSESVPKWQRDIINASKLLSEQLLKLESENNDLKNKLKDLNSQIANENSAQDKHTEIENLLEENSSLRSAIKELNESNRASKIQNETSQEKIMSLIADQLLSNKDVEWAREKIKEIELEKSELINSQQELMNNIASFKAEVANLKSNIDVLKNDKLSLMKELQISQDNKYASENSAMIVMKEELASLKSALVSVEEENKLLCESNEMLKTQLDTPSGEKITPEMRSLMEQNDFLQTDKARLQTRISSFKNENTSLINELKEARQKLSEQPDYENIKSKLSNYKSENIELLKEMKEINQVMKERGEAISKQGMEISDLHRKLQQFDDELKKSRETNERKDEEIKRMSEELKRGDDSQEKQQILIMEKDNLEALLKERDGIIISLQDDIEKLKQNQGNVSCDARSDNMSISTVSRVEETSRLNDLDESFEERYSKLRMLALKLKKRVNELTLLNKNLEESNIKLDQEKTDIAVKLQQMGNAAKNMQSIQNEYDKISDELEKRNAEFKNSDKTHQELKKEVEKLNTDLNNSNAKIDGLLKDLEYAKMEKSSLDMVIKELQNQISSMKIDSGDVKAKDAEISKIKDALALKESQLTLEESQHHITKETLEKVKKEVKKKSVLSLEMEDYERSMKELTSKMEEDKKKIVQMESTIDTQQATITSLKTQIKMLEDQMNTEEKISKEIKDLLNKANENLKDNENVILMKNEAISNLGKMLEEAKLQTEDLNLQLASALGEKEKSILLLGQEKLELNAKLKRTENRCNDIEDMLKLKSTELDDIKTEFAGYKVRAQSVLRQNTKKDLTQEENLKEEMAALKAEIDICRAESENLKSELESMQNERARLSSRCVELQSTITAAQAERERIAEQYSTLLQKEAQEQKNIKLQMTTLTQCYKKQISELEEASAEQIAKLKKELDFSRASMARAGIVPIKDNIVKKPSLQFIAIDSIQSSTESGSPPIHDGPESSAEINVALLEREEGEGSESTPSPSPTCVGKANRRGQRERREPMPLEQLLETGIPDDGPGIYSDGDIEQQLSSALKQIEIRDKRLSHLTEIVAEAEKEVARRSQLIESLKDEVRRCQRALDRGLHHHNQEYLKNVIVKFLTLNAGDERSRLVPVLNTILTLSPEETQQLNAAAKGLDPNANRGWGSYLPWPGGR